MGDLNPNNPVKVSGFSAAGYLKRNFNGYFSVKGNIAIGKIAGADSTSNQQQFRDRNLSFSTSLTEFSIIGEFNFLKYIPEAGQNKFTPYIYLGFGMVYYNPQATYQGTVYDLRPLNTEGASKSYPKYAWSIPYGVGIKYNFTGKWGLNADIGYRHPNTDHLDDVSRYYPSPDKLPNDLARALSDRSVNHIGAPGSQRGDLRPRDTYMFVGIGISYTFVTDKCYY
jgi:outer membrane protein W